MKKKYLTPKIEVFYLHHHVELLESSSVDQNDNTPDIGGGIGMNTDSIDKLLQG